MTKRTDAAPPDDTRGMTVQRLKRLKINVWHVSRDLFHRNVKSGKKSNRNLPHGQIYKRKLRVDVKGKQVPSTTSYSRKSAIAIVWFSSFRIGHVASERPKNSYSFSASRDA